jgi:hypothetical protein
MKTAVSALKWATAGFDSTGTLAMADGNAMAFRSINHLQRLYMMWR